MATCQHCQREVELDPGTEDRWIDPEADGDDVIWREVCDSNDTERAAPHEPRWIVEDWTGSRVWPTETFDSFDEARSRISQHADATTDNEDDYDGVCEDLYAVVAPS